MGDSGTEKPKVTPPEDEDNMPLSQLIAMKKSENQSPIPMTSEDGVKETPEAVVASTNATETHPSDDLPMEDQDESSNTLTRTTRSGLVRNWPTPNPHKTRTITTPAGKQPSGQKKPRQQKNGAKKRRRTQDENPEGTNETPDKPKEQATKSESKTPNETTPEQFPPKDPNEFYVEEEAHLYHNPQLPRHDPRGVLPSQLVPIPPPPPLPELPHTGSCEWKFDEPNRVLSAKFRAGNPPTPTDEAFLLHMMERNDISLISEGYLDWDRRDPCLWNIKHITGRLKERFCHKFRRFDTVVGSQGTETIVEHDGLYSMRMKDYLRYLELRSSYLKKTEDGSSPDFVFEDFKGIEHNIHVGKSALYLIDLDIHKLLPELYENFQSIFCYPKILPGGKHCMTHHVNANARPYMGPNMYITPPSTFTHFHQDGHGTVDSGHLVISGYNEVVMLRRLTERHKRHALWLLTGKQEHADKPKQEFFDGLYSEPHDDGLGTKPTWPDMTAIRECSRMGYCPSRMILKPGQHLHINKGRLHAFRKMSTGTVRKTDCHYQLRQDLIQEKGVSTGDDLCISVAWDWMFRGCTPHGTNREYLAALEATILNRKYGKLSLAIPELSLFQTAQSFVARNNASGFEMTTLESSATAPQIAGCRGILPGLRYVVREHLSAARDATLERSRSSEIGERVTLARHPNTDENPATSAVDPYGCIDFVCKLCSKELSNIYFHCDGCERLLNKDFNICCACHRGRLFMSTIQMNPTQSRKNSTINHTGNPQLNRRSRCAGKHGLACTLCGYCSGCSCRCHTWFTLNYRLFGKEEEEALLARVEEVAAMAIDSVTSPSDSLSASYLDDPEFTHKRLAAAARLWGHEKEII